MAYEWDNKKPTAQMLGRWQPFHDGHYTLFKEIIKKTGQVCIQIRDVQGVDDNPFDFETVKKNIEDRLNPEFKGQFKIMMVPNITNICYGRGVGYKIEEIELSKEKVVDEDAEVYEIAYRLYKDDFFEDAICFIDMTIPTLAEGSNLLSKFELLKAYAIGKYQNKDSYIAALEKVVVNFPQTEQGKKALEVMKRLKK